MLRGGELESVVYDGVIRASVEPIMRSHGNVKEESVILMLQDRLELLLGRLLLLLHTFEAKILFARDVVLVLPLVDSVDLTVSAPASTPTSTLASITDTTTPRATEPAKFVQSVLWDAGVKHSSVPDMLRPLGRLQTRGNPSGSTGPFVRNLPIFDDGRVTPRWRTVARHCQTVGGMRKSGGGG